MRVTRCAANILIGLVAIWLLAGCAVTGPIEAQPAAYEMPGTPATRPTRLGRVYVLRGFGDVFSMGMNTITRELQSQGVIATVHAHDQWQEIAGQIERDRAGLADPPPLVLIGHSWGADDSIRLARELGEHQIAVDLLVTVEAVTPPAVPSNVLRAWNVYKSRPLDFLPWWRGVAVHADRPDRTRLTQIDISRDWPQIDRWWLGHTDVDNQPAVQERIVAMVLASCPMSEEVPHAR